VVGVTTVFGNVPVWQAARNAARVVQFLASVPPVPIAEGAARPLRGRRLRCRPRHGRDGLGDLGMLPPMAERKDARPLSARRVLGRISRTSVDHVVALGPLTNVAGAVRRASGSAKRRWPTVAVAAGAVQGAQTGAPREFNLASDPAAARWLLESGVSLRWVPWGVTASVAFSRKEIERFRHRRSRLAQLIGQWLAYRDMARAGARGATAPDAIAMALAVEPSLGRWRARRLAISEGRAGQVRVVPGAPNAYVCESVDERRVRRWLWRAWERLSRANAIDS